MNCQANSSEIEHTSEGELLKIDYSDQASFHQKNLLDKFRIQVPIIVGLAMLSQYAFAIGYIGPSDTSHFVWISLAVCAITNGVSLLNYRRLRLFPGSRRLSYLFPAFALPYAGATFLLLWLRPPYSVPMLVTGAGAALGLAWLFSFYGRNATASPLLIVPSDKTYEMLTELPGLNYRLCSASDELDQSSSAVVADLRHDLTPEWERGLARSALNGSTIYNVKQVWESLTGRVRIDHLSENSFGTLKPNTLYFTCKSAADRLVGAAGLVFVAPVILIAAIVIKLSTPGPAFFLQERIGFRGKPFTIVKLRTMVADANTDGSRESAMTKVADPRITAVGKFMRQSRIDELPQLWNVLKGELSIIGPRPEAAALSHWYDEQLDFYAYRHVVKPGVTGWAQINQGHVASDEAVFRKLQYDFYYIKNFSLWLDILIAIKTVYVVLFRRGAK